MGPFQRKMRLYLLSLVINRSIPEDSDDLFTVSDWNSPSIAVSRLKELGFVSELYSLRNLRIDWWYLRKRCEDPPLDFNLTLTTSESILLFRIVLQALKDLQSGRPCDQGIWINDESPDMRKCFAGDHICYQHAEWYLAGIEEYEEFIHISPFFLETLVRKIKRDPIYSIPF